MRRSIVRDWHDAVQRNAAGADFPGTREKWKGEIAAFLPLLRKMNDAGVPHITIPRGGALTESPGE